MSFDKLDNIQELVMGNVMTQNLSDVLVGLCDLIKTLQNQVLTLQNNMETVVTSKDFIDEKNKRNQQMSQFEERLNSLDSVFHDNDMKRIQKEDELEEKMNSINDELKEAINKTAAKFGEDFQTQQMIFVQNYKTNDKKNKELKESIDNINTTIGSIQEEIKVLDTNSVYQMTKKIGDFESNLNDFHTNFENYKEDNRKEFMGYQKKKEDEQNELNEKLDKYNERLERVENEVMVLPDAKDINEVNNPDLAPILRAIQRDSRRIDAFDAHMSKLKLEFQETKETTQNCCNIIGDFSNEMAETKLEIGKTRTEFYCELQRHQNIEKKISKQISDLWKATQTISKNQADGFNQISLNNDSLSHTLAVLTRQNPKNSDFLEDVIINANQLKLDIDEFIVSNDLDKDVNSKITFSADQPKPRKVNLNIPIQNDDNQNEEGKTKIRTNQNIQLSTISNASAEQLRIDNENLLSSINELKADNEKEIARLEGELMKTVNNIEFQKIVDTIQNGLQHNQKMFHLLENKVNNIAEQVHEINTKQKANTQPQDNNPSNCITSRSLPRPIPTIPVRPITSASTRASNEALFNGRPAEKPRKMSLPPFKPENLQGFRLVSRSSMRSPK